MFNILKKLFSSKKTGSYGKGIILLSSDPAEIERICDSLGEDYRVILDLEALDNGDFCKVIVRKECEK